jgi:hypothetical protein
LWKLEIWIKVGVISAAAIPGPPTGVERELHEVRQPWFSTRSCGRAARQSAKLVQIYWIRSLQLQVGVEESEVSEFVVCVVVNVLGEVRVKDLKFTGIRGIPTPARDFTVVDTSEFVVLIQKSVSRISAAAANRSKAASP